MNFQSKKNPGFGIIEILAAVAIIGIAVSALAGFGYFSLKSTENSKRSLSAVNLASESIEAAKSIKEENWNLLSGLVLGSSYHPAKSGSPLKWMFAAGSENIDGFARSAVFEAVYRDADDNISISGSLDPETLKIISTVSWIEQNQSKQVILTSYLANWK